MCNLCASNKQSRVPAEIAIHFPGLKGINNPHVRVFPEMLVCLNCGRAEFTIPEGELHMLVEGEAADLRIATKGDKATAKPGLLDGRNQVGTKTRF